MAKNEVVFTDITFQVTGYYGNIYSLDKVQSVELKEEPPTVTEQISGIVQDDFKRGTLRQKSMVNVGCIY